MKNCLRLTVIGPLLIALALTLAPSLLEKAFHQERQGPQTPPATGPSQAERDSIVPGACGREVARNRDEKETTIADLVDGRITLFEAAARFRRLNGERIGPVPEPSIPSDANERLCEEVIHWAWCRLREFYPGAADDLVVPFKEELRRHKERHGGRVLLP